MKKNIAAALIFLLVMAGMTFPLVLKLNTSIAGFFSTDELYSVLWDCWRIKFSVMHGLSLTGTNFISAPEGVSFYSSGYVSYLWIIWHHMLSMLVSPPLSLNIELLFNMFLSAFFTYLLVRHLTGRWISGVLSGVIFGFCPYQFMRLWQHVSLTYTQWLPLVLYTVILMREQRTTRAFVLFLLSLLCLCSFDFITTFFGHIMLASYLVYSLAQFFSRQVFNKRAWWEEESGYWKRVFIVWLVAMILLSPQFYPLVKNIFKFSHSTVASAHNPFRRSFDDLFSQSARPLSYFLPAAVHPVFGKFTEQFVGGGLYGGSFTEHTLYLGWMPLLLAGIAFGKWRQLRKTKVVDVHTQYAIRDTQYCFYIGFFIFLGIVAWFFSQPPWWKWGSLKIYMPSFFMYKILPMYRAYCRFGIVVMLAIAVLAGFGLKFLMGWFNSAKTKVVIATIACVLVLFEFWNWPAYKVIDVSRVPEVYYWLKEQPGDFIIAEYPLDADSQNVLFKFFQSTHIKRMINSTSPGSPTNDIAKTITRLSEPRTAGVLKTLEVKYVLVHREDYLKGEKMEEIEDLHNISRNPGLKLIKSFSAQSCPENGIMCVEQTGPIDVYEVVFETFSPRATKIISK